MNRIQTLITGATAVAVLTAGGVFAAPASAQAASWTAYCQQHVNDGAPYAAVADQTTWCRVQAGPAAIGDGQTKYTGTVDGVMGSNSWKGLQAYLKKNHGYGGPIDGVPGTQTYAAMQRFAAQNNLYTGPIDGDMGANSWRGFNQNLRILFFSN